MEDYKLLFYILLAIGYFLISNWRKFFKSVDETEQPKRFRDENEPPVQRPQHKPVVPATSFEDILRELQPKVEQAKMQGGSVAEQTVTPAATIEAPRPRVYEHQSPTAVSLEVSMPKRTSIERQASFEPYTIKQPTTLRKFDPSILRKPETARDAFILSEIFNRKYN